MIVRTSLVPDGVRYAGRVPGRIVGRSVAGGHVDVLTGDGVLRIHEVTTGDAEPVPASSVITSTRQTLGLRAGDLIPRIEALEKQIEQLSQRACESQA
jgi:methionyl-tRNA formyltransferase